MFAADAGDYSGCYETYLAAANEIIQHSNDEDIRGILNKAMADVLQLSNPTGQAWGLRVAFDQIKDRGRHGMGSHATVPAAAASPAKSAAVASAGPSTSGEEEKAVSTKVLFVCREVYETEAAYVKDLQTMIRIFKQPVSPRVRTPGRHPCYCTLSYRGQPRGARSLAWPHLNWASPFEPNPNQVSPQIIDEHASAQIFSNVEVRGDDATPLARPPAQPRALTLPLSLAGTAALVPASALALAPALALAVALAHHPFRHPRPNPQPE